MRKVLGLTTGILVLLLASTVMASLYAEKIPDPSIFTSIQPLWTALIETESGELLTVSFLEFKGKEGVFGGILGYLNDGRDEYISDRATFFYDQEVTSLRRGCDPAPQAGEEAPVTGTEAALRECLDACPFDTTFDCENQCAIDLDCGSVITCNTVGPGFERRCGISSIIQSFNENKLEMNFDPALGKVTGQGSSYNGQQFKVIKQEGILTAEIFAVR